MKKFIRKARRGFTLVEIMSVVSIGVLVSAAISSVVVGAFAAARNSVGRNNASELTSCYYKAESAGLASTAATSYSGAGIPNTIDSVTYRMQSTFTPGSYAWDATESRFTYAGAGATP